MKMVASFQSPNFALLVYYCATYTSTLSFRSNELDHKLIIFFFFFFFLKKTLIIFLLILIFDSTPKFHVFIPFISVPFIIILTFLEFEFKAEIKPPNTKRIKINFNFIL